MESKITLSEMQTTVDDYIRQFKTGYFGPLAQMARLTEEMGELAKEINHHYGEKQKKATEPAKAIPEEMGDVLIVLLMMANSLDIDLTEAFEKNMDKFQKRDQFRFERVDGRVGEKKEK